MNSKVLIISTIIFILVVTGSVIATVVSNNQEELVEETSEELTDLFTAMMEYAYMEGQIDALEGDVRIKEFGTDWVWTKSPWDDSRDTIHQYRSQY